MDFRPSWFFVVVVVFWAILNTDLIFVSRVEWDLSYFLVLFPHQFDRPAGELDALQQGRLGGVTGHVSLQDW